MKIVYLDTPVELSAVVRTIPQAGDSINIILKNEVSGLVIDLPTTWTYSKQRLNFSFDIDSDLKAGNHYQITLKNGSNVIYLGNLLVVKQNTNIQNYTPSTQRTQRFKSKAV